jgi:hypothetical protein
MALSLFFVIYLRVSFFISEQCITLEKKMAKTKRRSCKGRRRSLKRRGGVSYFKLPFEQRQTYHDPRRFSTPQQSAARLGYDTKQVIQKAPTLTIPDMLHRQYGDIEDRIHYAMKPLRGKFSAARASTASAARRVRASLFRAMGFHSHHLDHDKLVTVPEDRKSGYRLFENSAKRSYIVTPNGNLHEATSAHLGPIGYWPHPRLNEMTAKFLPGHEPNVDQTWIISQYH